MRKTSDLFSSTTCAFIKAQADPSQGFYPLKGPYLKVLSENEGHKNDPKRRYSSMAAYGSGYQEPARTRFQHIPDEELKYYRTGD